MDARLLPILGAVLASVLAATGAQADVYVAEPGYSNGQPAILIFASDATADEPPVRTIAGSNTGFTTPFSVTVDPVNEEIYVSEFPILGGAGKILVFPLDADGNVAPIRTLVDGPSSQLKWPRKVAVDNVNDEIIVASFNILDPPPRTVLLDPRLPANGRRGRRAAAQHLRREHPPQQPPRPRRRSRARRDHHKQLQR